MIIPFQTEIVKAAPSLFVKPLQLVPLTVQHSAILYALKHVFCDSLQDGDFEFLEGKWLEISVTEIANKTYISYIDNQLVVESTQRKADVRFSAGLNDLVLVAARKEDPDTLFFQRRLSIEGDTELGLEIKNLMDSIDLEGLPVPIKHLLDKLAEFISRGLAGSPKLETHYADQN